MSSSSVLSPPPSPHPAPVPLTSSSSLTHCPELDLSVTLSPAPKTGREHLKPRPPRTGEKSDQSQRKSHPRRHTGRTRNTQVCFEEPVAITVTPEPHITLSRDASSQQPVRGQRSSRGRPCVKPPAAAAIQDPVCLKNAELHTTLALKAELQSLQGVEFNTQKAIQETLQRSERTKNLINTKATEVVNVSRSQQLFTSLVSVSVQQDELISQALQERLLLAPSPHCRDKTAEGPTLLHFMTSDLFRQVPFPPMEDPVGYKLHPSTWPHHSTFDLYNRHSRWEAAP
ncbi:protein phosphatase 1 regulatory subunit 35 [Anabas testudineus]|uniref:Protein phosphatase 1 regulatory subunit 35 C-terminal domain-containing protein n=1 Tax=Anabas testudineus TaxID=64144 RepID=A0A3Q1I3A1_ANATE|nr:protein phosphatase 1 regulatory subunit 35 [Anabas testudineus]XP_026214368.1 protein phosphatase 1 regulatory subunit 35 [Anabas testudineus]